MSERDNDKRKWVKRCLNKERITKRWKEDVNMKILRKKLERKKENENNKFRMKSKFAAYRWHKYSLLNSYAKLQWTMGKREITLWRLLFHLAPIQNNEETKRIKTKTSRYLKTCHVKVLWIAREYIYTVFSVCVYHISFIHREVCEMIIGWTAA